jgi:hypothetical protein
MQSGSLDLGRTKRRIDALIGELNRESAAIAAPNRNTASPSGDTSMHPYQNMTDQYAGGASSYGGSSPSEADQAMSTNTAKIEGIKQELLHLQAELRSRLGDWNRDSQELRQDGQDIRQVQGVSDLYQKAQDAAYREQTRIVGLMNTISAAIDRAQQAIPMHAGCAGRQAHRSIDQIVGQSNDLYRGSAANNYKLPILGYVIPLLDKGRYGKVALQTITEYPTPRLRQDSSDRQGTLWDKVIRGLGYFEKQNLQDYKVELPSYYYQIFPGGYLPADEYEIRP